MNAAERARWRVCRGLQEPFWIAARRREAIEFLHAIAGGRGADAASARIALEHVGERVERAELDEELLDLVSLTRATADEDDDEW